MRPTKPVSDLLNEIQARLEALEQSLVRRLEAAHVSRRAKLPFHVIQYRETLAWRCADLGRDAYEAIRDNRLTTGALLVRAVVETVAAQWYLHLKVSRAVESGSPQDLETSVSRLLLGSRTSSDMPDPINVMTFVQAANKEIEGFLAQFERLCEFAHPNWAGTSLIYSSPNLEERAVTYGRGIRKADSLEVLAVVNLSVALRMFEIAYNRLSDTQERLVELCDSQLPAEN